MVLWRRQRGNIPGQVRSRELCWICGREARVKSNPSQTGSADDEMSETTQLLRAWAGGDQAALERLTPRVYRTLRRIAGYQLQNERAGQTLQATALVHEAYIELIDVKNVDWQHRAHFFAA